MDVLEKITETVHAHTKGKTIGNVGVIATDKGNVLIDTSMFPVMAREIRVELEKIRTGRILGVILTHYHPDHVWGNQAFSDLDIHAHQTLHDNMKSALASRWTPEQLETMKNNDPERAELLEDLTIVLPNKVFTGKKHVLDEDNSIQVFHVGGHTSCSSIIYHEEERVIFSGDDLFAGFFPWGGDPTASPYEWVDAINVMLELHPRVIVPGHGDVQFSLNELNNFGRFLQKIIQEGERLARDGVEEEDAVKVLSEIDYHPPRRPDMKPLTLKRFYQVIRERLA